MYALLNVAFALLAGLLLSLIHSSAPLTLKALPGVTAEQLAAMDVEKDLEKDV